MASDFTDRERYYIAEMEEMAAFHPDKNPWTKRGPKTGYYIKDPNTGKKLWNEVDLTKLWSEWKNYKDYGQRVGKPKPPETWLTRRRDYMERRYSNTPESGFSGVMGPAATQRKKLLGR